MVNDIQIEICGAGLTAVIVTGRFNDFLTEQLRQASINCLVQHGVADNDIHHIWVPGSNEVPLAVEAMIKRFKPDIALGLGCVIEGETRHADLILDQVSHSMARLGHEYKLPVINGVIAAHTMQQAVERCSQQHGNKGWACALAALEMASILRSLSGGEV
jgi:6,7-dimethyl-8-ribityllumazine synthase